MESEKTAINSCGPIIIAGGIGSGKSVVARVLRLRGYGVFDCDYEARVLMEHDADLQKRIREVAGKSVYSAGRLDRKALAEKFFSDPVLRENVNTAVHAAVRDRIAVWLEESEKNVFIETAIAALSGIARMAREIWLVEASDLTRIERVRGRDAREESQIRHIMEAQAGEEALLEASGIPLRRIRNDKDSQLLENIPKMYYYK